VPRLEEVLAAPERLAGLPPAVVLELRRQALALAQAADAALWGHLLNGQPAGPPGGAGAAADRLLTPAEAAALLGVKRRWLQDHGGSTGARRVLSPRRIRYSEQVLRKYAARERA
jgi:hypothetical protein